MRHFTQAILLIICVTTATPALSNSPWRWVYPRPNNLALNAVAFQDANNAIACGDFGVILRTTDAGLTWQTVREPNINYPSLNAIYIVDPYEAVIAGDQGITMRTYNGGLTWNQMGFYPGVDFLSIHFIDDNTGMAAGTGDVYLSVDGGALWDPLGVFNVPVNMYDVQLTGPNEAVAVGEWGAIMQTLDGGATWQERTPSPYTSSSFTALSFSSPTDGIAAAEGLLYATSDGGATWSVVWENLEVNVGRTITDVCAMAGGEIVSVGRSYDNSYWKPPAVVSSGFGLWTGDGSTWNNWNQPLPLRAIDMNSGVGLAVGDAGTIVRYTGAGWEPAGGATAVQQTRGSADFDGDNGVLASAVDRQFSDGSGGWTNFFITANGGQTWHEQPYNNGKICDVAFSGNNVVYAIGRSVDDTENLIIKSGSAGNSWAPVWNAPGSHVNALDFFTPDRGIAVGDDGHAYVIDNDAVTVLQTATPYALSDVSAPTPVVAFAVGDYGTILRSGDAGQTWSVQSAPTSRHLRAVHFVTSQSGVAVGLMGTVLRTDDGGANWIQQTSSTSRDLFGVFMADPAVVYAVGGQGVALRTTDAGANWQSEQTLTPLTLGDVIEVDPTRVVAVGANQTVMTRSIGVLPVAFSKFSGTVGGSRVTLQWDVSVDEPFVGFEMYRADGNDMARRIAVLNPSDRAYVDANVRPNTTYTYHLVAVHNDGAEVRSMPWSVETGRLEALLAQNYPNPFNPTTRIRFDVPEQEHVELTVHDPAGRRITTLVSASLSAGGHDVEWNGRDTNGNLVASGVYFYRLRAGNVTETRKMLLLK